MNILLFIIITQSQFNFLPVIISFYLVCVIAELWTIRDYDFLNEKKMQWTNFYFFLKSFPSKLSKLTSKNNSTNLMEFWNYVFIV